jgi:tetratricopeptide (TPR) repeat protein
LLRSEELNSNLDDKRFDLQIELGDQHEKTGEVNKSLECFKYAYDMAVALKDKRHQVDALVRITEVYFYKGEIETSIKYAKVAEELLKDVNYVQGKLDISLYLLKVYFTKNQIYKAREIGNEALKLCTEEYIIYKGRILNALAGLYSELTSVDEHLELLQQSLACFEKVNLLRGTLGVLNNIAVVYSDKLQDYEKALEYFFKLKERSEDGNYLQFNTFAYVNIGEAYLKCLRYEEALSFCKLALEKAKAANMEIAVFYTYAILIIINIKLYNYSEAYDYFNLANEELKNYPDQGDRLPWYYTSTATLFLEFGEIHKANHNIKQALELLGNEDTITKWNTGITYEFMKLKGAKNSTEVLATIEGIEYILTKYKNSEVILSIVYAAALELLNLRQEAIAFKLIDEYKYIETKRPETLLKHKYIEALRSSNEVKTQMLKASLELAKGTKDTKLYILICNSLGKGYFKLKDYEKALTYYVEACRQIIDIVSTVPQEFRIQFLNSNGFVELYNRVVEIKEQYYEKGVENQKRYKNIHDEDQLVEFFIDLNKTLK